MDQQENLEIAGDAEKRHYKCRFCKKKGLTQSGRWRHEHSKHAQRFAARNAAKVEKKTNQCQ